MASILATIIGHVRARALTVEEPRRDILFRESANVDGFSDDIATTATDLWDLANSTDHVSVYLAPTDEQLHNVKSSDASDTLLGGGARTIRISFLPSWAEKEITEDIEMDGTNDVPMLNDCVVINKVQVLTNGADAINVGQITITAAIDDTVSAAIMPGVGETKMGVRGIPSTQTGFITGWGGSFTKAPGVVASILFGLMVNPDPEN